MKAYQVRGRVAVGVELLDVVATVAIPAPGQPELSARNAARIVLADVISMLDAHGVWCMWADAPYIDEVDDQVLVEQHLVD